MYISYVQTCSKNEQIQNPLIIATFRYINRDIETLCNGSKGSISNSGVGLHKCDKQETCDTEIEPNVLKLTSPMIVIGDIHGQFYDLLTIFSKYGMPPNRKYLFLGDYIDRGEFGVEVLTILMFLKVKFPKNIYLLRGNHECRILTSAHNFRSECVNKYSAKVYELVMILFESLPLCSIVDNKFFCVHAGISPNLHLICTKLSISEQIQKLNRFAQIPQKGVMCDMLWSDPIDQQKKQWTFNTNRSCSYFYSRMHTVNFLEKNKLEMIIRGHEVHLQGYKYQQNNHKNYMNVLTIFSAPNYCDRYNNLAAVALISKQDLKIDTFFHVEHPNNLNSHFNIFQWSIGVLGNEVSKIFMQLMKSKLKTSQKTILQPIQKIRDRLQLCEQMETFNRLLKIKQEHEQKQIIRQDKNNITFGMPQDFKSQQNEQKSQKIRSFSLCKINDLQEEAMPKDYGSKKQLDQQVINSLGKILDDTSIQVTDSDQSSKNRRQSVVMIQEIEQKKLSMFTVGNKCPPIFGPKIRNFDKVQIKRKNK